MHPQPEGLPCGIHLPIAGCQAPLGRQSAVTFPKPLTQRPVQIVLGGVLAPQEKLPFGAIGLPVQAAGSR